MAGSKGGQEPGSGKRKQSWEKTKYVSKTKVRQAKCRVCQKEMAAQNYPRHLKEKHAEVWNSSKGDIREWGDQPLHFFKPPPTASVEVAKPDEENGEESDLDLDISRTPYRSRIPPIEAEELDVESEVESEAQTIAILEDLPDPENQNQDRERGRGRSLTRGPPHRRDRSRNSSPLFRVQDANFYSPCKSRTRCHSARRIF